MSSHDAIGIQLNNPNEGLFRLSIIDSFQDEGHHVFGKVNSGIVREGNTLLIMPNKVQVKVVEIFIDDDRVSSAGAGDNVRVKVAAIEALKIPPGCVLCSVEKPIPVVEEFIAKLRVLDLSDRIHMLTAGSVNVLHIHSVVQDCQFLELIQQIDPKTRKPMDKKVLFVTTGALVVCRIKVNDMISIERFSDSQHFGRFKLRSYQGTTVAVGKVTELV